MKKLLAVIGLTTVLAFGLTACGGGGSSSGGDTGGDSKKEASSEPVELSLVESGYSTGSSGYIYYAVCIENTNESKAAEFPVVTVVGKDANGSIVFSDDWTLSGVLPGEKAYYASQAGNGAVPETVEFSVTTDSKNWKNADAYPEGIYSIDSTNYVEGSYGMSSFTGQITLTQDNEDFAKPMIVVVLRDGDGAIVGGYNTYLSSDLTEGSPAAFEVTAYDMPEFAAFEVCANPWL